MFYQHRGGEQLWIHALKAKCELCPFPISLINQGVSCPLFYFLTCSNIFFLFFINLSKLRLNRNLFFLFIVFCLVIWYQINFVLISCYFRNLITDYHDYCLLKNKCICIHNTCILVYLKICKSLLQNYSLVVIPQLL